MGFNICSSSLIRWFSRNQGYCSVWHELFLLQCNSPFQVVFAIQDESVLLLKLPQLGVNIKRSTKIRLPLFVSILGQIPGCNGAKVSSNSQLLKSHEGHLEMTVQVDQKTAYLKPLKSCLDFSNSWTNSFTIRLSLSSNSAIGDVYLQLTAN